MEGFSTISHKNKTIYYIDYSSIGESKDKVIQLLKGVMDEYINQKLPQKSVLALTNISNLHIDSDIINIFKQTREKTAPFEKRVAVIGMKRLQQVAYNFIITLTHKDLIRAFDSESEAMDWLVSDIP
jgi:phosphoribulokinase